MQLDALDNILSDSELVEHLVVGAVAMTTLDLERCPKQETETKCKHL